jgi:hypothetical protein
MDYQLFNMCPFTVASIGGEVTVMGSGQGQYTWTHSPCIKETCRLWTYKVDEKGEIYAEGCSFQLVGLNRMKLIKISKLKIKL